MVGEAVAAVGIGWWGNAGSDGDMVGKPYVGVSSSPEEVGVAVEVGEDGGGDRGVDAVNPGSSGIVVLQVGGVGLGHFNEVSCH